MKPSIETRDGLKEIEQKYHFKYDFSKPINEQDFPSEEAKKVFIKGLNQHIFSLRLDIISFLRDLKDVNSQSIKVIQSHALASDFSKSWSSYIQFNLKQYPKNVCQIRLSDHYNKNVLNRDLTYFMNLGTFLDNNIKFRLKSFIMTCEYKLARKNNVEKTAPIVVRQSITPRVHIKESEYDNLVGSMRVAGFYDIDNDKFILLKRKEKPDYNNGDKECDYNHMAQPGFLEEMNYSRFGIEDLGKITCYIEATTKVNARRTRAVIERHFKEIPIEQFQIEYMDNDDYKYEEIII